MCMIFIYTFSFYSFADLVEIKNGVKTTYADKPRALLDTLKKPYDFKWALDKKGDWRLYIRNMTGRLVSTSNMWVNIARKVTGENGSELQVVDYYYFDYHEKMVTGWLIDKDGNTFYLNTDENELGRMVRGWQKIGNDYYYFNQQNGILLKNAITIDGFYVDEEGKWK